MGLPVVVVAGLGNPGVRYEDTRHNIGFMLLDRVAAKAATRFFVREGASLVASARLEGRDTLLVKPQTFMNRSGVALREVLGGAPPPGGLVVAHDDLDLPFGSLRLRAGGGHGGHNGVRSIIEELGASEFVRIKCGIGRPPPGVETADHVLAPFSPEERAALPQFLERAEEALALLLRENLAAAMQRFHTRTP